jgi:hypothetical protein
MSTNGVEGAGSTGAEGDAPQVNENMMAKVAIVGTIGVGATLIEASLIPGILIGAAAILAPKYLPGVREKMRPLLKSTIRGAYRLSEKTREAFAEAQEQVQDIMAEARHENREAEASPAPAAAPTHQD